MGQAQHSQFSKTVCFLESFLEYEDTNKAQTNDYKKDKFLCADKIHNFIRWGIQDIL